MVTLHSRTSKPANPLHVQASRRDTATSDTIAPAGPLLSLLGNYQLSRLGATMMPTVDVTETSPAGVVAVRRTYTLSFVLLVALISFLLGSLLRSLLTRELRLPSTVTRLS